MTEKWEVRLRMRTPLWTGDVDRTSSTVRETALIGNLRWWYEALIRGFGGHACDPTDTDAGKACPQESKDGQAVICPACQLFGCTGYARRFRLRCSPADSEDLFFAATDAGYTSTGNWLWRIFGGEETGGSKSGKGAATSFRLGVKQLWANNPRLIFTSSVPEAESILNRLKYLLHLVVRYGGIGAKQQHGFGQVEWVPNAAPASNDLQAGRKAIHESIEKTGAKKSSPLLPDFSRFFLMTFEVEENAFNRGWKNIGQPSQYYRREYIPCAFSLRYRTSLDGPGLRIEFREHFENRERVHTLMGNSRRDASDEDRSASRIFVSHPFRVGKNYLVKVYGFVPLGLFTNGTEVGPREVATWAEECFTQKLFRGCKRQQTIFWETIQNEKL
jgi:CRISPR-associated protein Cmr1